jgi:hypothetical protein
MARIRSVHPELFTDEAFAELSMAARVLIIGIWTQCDDHGIFEHKPLGLKMRIFPAENSIDMAVLLRELEDAKCIKPFNVDGRPYAAVRNFCLYQRPKKPTFKHPFPDWCRTYVALDRRSTEAEEDPDTPIPGPSGKLLYNRSPTSGEKPPHRRGEEGSGREEDNPTDSEKTVVVVVPDAKAETTTTTTVSKKASQLKAGGLGALLGTPLPADWVPDDQLCEKVLADFGMTNVNAELPAFHALNVQNGTMSQDWRATFYLFAKRWKERQVRATPHIELSPKFGPPSSPLFKPTEGNWQSVAKLYAETGHWSRQVGPDPMSPACRCPKPILTMHGIDPETGDRSNQSPPRIPAVTPSSPSSGENVRI